MESWSHALRTVIWQESLFQQGENVSNGDKKRSQKGIKNPTKINFLTVLRPPQKTYSP